VLHRGVAAAGGEGGVVIELYLACAAFGLVLVGASALLGGGDHDGDGDHDLEADGDHDLGHDADHDVGHDVDHGPGDLHDAGMALAHVHAEPGPWLPFTSLRFWSFFTAAFGVTGAALVAGGVLEPFAGLVAAPTGLAVGWGAALLLRQLRTDTVSGEVTLDRYAGEEARVVLAVRPGGTGKIRLTTRTGVLDLPARTLDAHEIGVGSPVLVAAVRDGIADVTALAGSPPTRQRAMEGTRQP
jgi:hypothetical protein